ncbi:hypothetical protein FHG87_016220 [Trinorchestia longiramus]|nr:hypothetical protein FHG87_016220 [Trinorchestia longiramus]
MGVRRWECGDQAVCGRTGGCECPPCYSGDACDEYDDRHPIVLEKADDNILIREDHSGTHFMSMSNSIMQHKFL